jgi:hypothetical protein
MTVNGKHMVDAKNMEQSRKHGTWEHAVDAEPLAPLDLDRASSRLTVTIGPEDLYREANSYPGKQLRRKS